MTDGQKLKQFRDKRGIQNKTLYQLFGMTRNNLHTWYSKDVLSDKIKRKITYTLGENVFELNARELLRLKIDIEELTPLDYDSALLSQRKERLVQAESEIVYKTHPNIDQVYELLEEIMVETKATNKKVVQAMFLLDSKK